ncbi:hypothetical protein DRQ53_10035 [bacterium]|nr:MAG: hypothetical protein DRQ53_10035 [bacterium]
MWRTTVLADCQYHLYIGRIIDLIPVKLYCMRTRTVSHSRICTLAEVPSICLSSQWLLNCFKNDGRTITNDITEVSGNLWSNRTQDIDKVVVIVILPRLDDHRNIIIRTFCRVISIRVKTTCSPVIIVIITIVDRLLFNYYIADSDDAVEGI